MNTQPSFLENNPFGITTEAQHNLIAPEQVQDPFAIVTEAAHQSFVTPDIQRLAAPVSETALADSRAIIKDAGLTDKIADMRAKAEAEYNRANAARAHFFMGQVMVGQMIRDAQKENDDTDEVAARRKVVALRSRKSDQKLAA